MHLQHRAAVSCSATCTGRQNRCIILRPSQTTTTVIARAAASQAQDVDAKASILSVLKRAAKTRDVKPPEVLSAIVALEKLKLKPDGWDGLLTADKPRWRLIYSAGSKDVTAAVKRQPGGHGNYIPLLAACNKYEGGRFINGVFLGPVASLTFDGPYTMSGRQLQFDVDTMQLGVGPWVLPIPLKAKKAIADMDPAARKKLPFFLFAYMDEDIVVARGRSGGLAMWARADTQWMADSGVLQRYN